jgi:hypothetical protein
VSDPGPLTRAATSGDPGLLGLEQAVVDSAERTGPSDEALEAVIRYCERQQQIAHGQIDPVELRELVRTASDAMFKGGVEISKRFQDALDIRLRNLSAPAFQNAKALMANSGANAEADPVDVAAGSLVLTKGDTLIRGAGMDTAFRPTYRGQAASSGPVGSDGHHSFNLCRTEIGTAPAAPVHRGDERRHFVRHDRYSQAGLAYWMRPTVAWT